MTTTSINLLRSSPEHAPRVRLRYGLNETDNWWNLSFGSCRQRIVRRLRCLRPSVIRIFLFDKHAPNPVCEWSLFEKYVQSVLDVGAVPMITFAKFPPPYDDPGNIRTFVHRCVDVAWGCMEKWGERVRNWLWCVWNEPNNNLIGGGLSFAQYCRIYNDVSHGLIRTLEPILRGSNPLVGGPAVDGFQPFWLDWIQQCIEEIDERHLGFVSWHRYGDWRPDLGIPAPRDATYAALLAAQTPEYEARARSVARLLVGRNVLNVCGELNVLSHPDPGVSRRFNQSAFGAAYYASALAHLVRGGADLELWWTATDSSASAYGLVGNSGAPTLTYRAKQLFARYVRIGDRYHFTCERASSGIEVLSTWGDDGRRSAIVVHLAPHRCEVDIQGIGEPPMLLRLDATTGNRIARGLGTTIRFEGYGVAVISNARTMQHKGRAT